MGDYLLAQVGALQDVRSELTKLRGTIFYRVLEDLHAHLYNKGEFRYIVNQLSILQTIKQYVLKKKNINSQCPVKT